MVQSLIESKQPKIKGKANVAFLIDVTASMGGCLENLKANLLELSNQIGTISKEQYGVAEPDISYCAMGYRDLTTPEPEEYKIVRMAPTFTKNLDDLKVFFSDEKMQAAGGDTEPESALDALVIAAREFKWDQPVRILLLLTDASTHKVLHPSTTGGTQIDENDSMNVVQEELMSRKLRLIVFGPKDVPEYMKVATFNCCRYEPMEKAGDTLRNFKDAAMFKDQIVKLVAKSVSQSTSQPVAYAS